LSCNFTLPPIRRPCDLLPSTQAVKLAPAPGPASVKQPDQPRPEEVLQDGGIGLAGRPASGTASGRDEEPRPPPLLSGAQLQGAKLSDAQLQGGSLREAQLTGANLADIKVYATDFSGADLSLADLRGLSIDPVEWDDDIVIDNDPFSDMNRLQKVLIDYTGYGIVGPSKQQLQALISRFWKIAYDLPSGRTQLSPIDAFDTMYFQEGLFAIWRAPPDVAEFEQQRSAYLAGLSCNAPYVAEAMSKRDAPVLAQALLDKSMDKNCVALAEVVEKNRRRLNRMANKETD